MEKVFDVIVVGAGPGGSTAASLMARAGASVLLLDRARFPRDKVCGDGLTPRALYWLDVLGCADQVLEASHSCITHADLYFDGKQALTGSFPQNGPYPGFSVLLARKKLDHILLRHAIAGGALFRGQCNVQGLRRESDGIVIEAVSEKARVDFKGRTVIGADGAGSSVSRALGNRLLDGVTAVSMRGYFTGVTGARGTIQVHFEESFFPGYGWMFVDDDGLANVGVGCAVDRRSGVRDLVPKIYRRFVAETLREQLRNATPAGSPRGGWSAFFKPRRMVSERVILIGDAANLGDPISGGGIHLAMESAHVAVPVLLDALSRGDCSEASLGRYESVWEQRNGVDRRVGDLLLAIARNLELRRLWLWALRSIAAMARQDPAFREFCGGIFSGVNPARDALNPARLIGAAPLDPMLWWTALADGGAPVRDAAAAFMESLKMARRIAQDPEPTLQWGFDVFSKIAQLVACYVSSRSSMPSGMEGRHEWPSAFSAP
jgi:geranylgeranyl reductase family protein